MNDASQADTVGTRARWKKLRSRLATALLIALVGCLLAVNLQINRQAAVLLDHRDRVRATFESQSRDLERLEQLRKVTKKIEFQLHAQREYLRWAMRRNTRDVERFLVTDGQRICWNEVASLDTDNDRFVIYLPPGSHQLKYLAENHDGDGRQYQIEKMTRRHGIETSHASEEIELNGDAVYEIHVRFNTEPSRHFEVAVHDRDGEKVDARTTPIDVLVDRPTTMLIIQRQYVAYPSGFDTNYAATQHMRGDNRDTVPVVRLTGMTVLPSKPQTPGAAGLYVWIESSTPPSVAPVVLANHYERITQWRTHLNPSSRDREFERLFQPYDGSGRYYFRDDVFLHP